MMLIIYKVANKVKFRKKISIPSFFGDLLD